MGGKPSLCGGRADETLEDEGDEVGQEEKKAAADPSFCEKLYKKISETDNDYARDFEPDEPKPAPNRITICQFKRWASRTAKCNPLWRRCMKSDDKIDLKKFETALSSDNEYVVLGQLLMDIKLAGGDGELLQPHLKARKHWFGWEDSKVKKYFEEILKEAGKSEDDGLSRDDLRNFGNARNCLDIRIDYAFGYSEWNEAQKRLDNSNTNAPKYVSFTVKQMQEAFNQKGPKAANKELGQLLRAFSAAVAAPGTHKDDVEKTDMFYWDPPQADTGDAYPDMNNGGGGGGSGEERKELKENPEIEQGHAFPSLGPKNEEPNPAEKPEDVGKHDDVAPAPADSKPDAEGPKPDAKDAKPPEQASAYPTLG